MLGYIHACPSSVHIYICVCIYTCPHIVSAKVSLHYRVSPYPAILLLIMILHAVLVLPVIAASIVSYYTML